MATADLKTSYTPDDLLTLPDADHFELVDGTLVERTVSVLSSWVGGELYGRLRDHCRATRAGQVWPADNGIQCFPFAPNQVRRPDVSFIQAERISPELFQHGYVRIAPDLVVEVTSPNDLVGDVEAKVEEYLAAGVRLIWIIHPEARTVQIQRPDGSSARLRRHQELDGEDVVPGFRCPIAELFPTPV